MTSNPVATISYNNPEFLKIVLNEKIKSGELLYWSYIIHKGDEDDLKDHIHLRVIPNTRIDLAKFAKDFIEVLPPDKYGNEQKPLRTLLWRNSEYKNWFMYVVHNPDYLEVHNLTRNYHYTFDDFVSSSPDDTRILYHESREWFYNSTEMVEKLIQDKMIDGCTLSDLVRSGMIRAKDVFKFKQYASALCDVHTLDQTPMLLKYLKKLVLKSDDLEEKK